MIHNWLIDRLRRRLSRVERLADRWEAEAFAALRRNECRKARVLFSAATGVRRALEDQ